MRIYLCVFKKYIIMLLRILIVILVVVGYGLVEVVMMVRRRVNFYWFFIVMMCGILIIVIFIGWVRCWISFLDFGMLDIIGLLWLWSLFIWILVINSLWCVFILNGRVRWCRYNWLKWFLILLMVIILIFLFLLLVILILSLVRDYTLLWFLDLLIFGFWVLSRVWRSLCWIMRSWCWVV